MIDSQESTREATALTGNLLPVDLTIHDYCGRETRCALHTLPAMVGREECADVQLTDPWASHWHCEIDQIGYELVVRDLNSKNGVFLRGHRVREANVLSGERFIVARTEIIVHYPGAAQTAIEAEAIKPSQQNRLPTSLPDTWELF